MSTPLASSAPANSNSGLPTGAKAGIGIGVAVVFVLAVLAGIWLLMRRRNGRNSVPQRESEKYQQCDFYTPAAELTAERPPVELSAKQRFELEARPLE